MFLLMHSNGFEIIYDDRFADYIDFLEFGTMRSRAHAGFISNDTFWEVVAFLEAELLGKDYGQFYNDTNELDELVYDEFINTSSEARDIQMQRSLNRNGAIV